jgi:hypothetical protein
MRKVGGMNGKLQVIVIQKTLELTTKQTHSADD